MTQPNSTVTDQQRALEWLWPNVCIGRQRENQYSLETRPFQPICRSYVYRKILVLVIVGLVSYLWHSWCLNFWSLSPWLIAHAGYREAVLNCTMWVVCRLIKDVSRRLTLFMANLSCLTGTQTCSVLLCFATNTYKIRWILSIWTLKVASFRYTT